MLPKNLDSQSSDFRPYEGIREYRNRLSSEFYSSNEMVENPPEPCDFKVGDRVSFTNDNGVFFKGPYTVIGFTTEKNKLGNRFIHINYDCVWFPVSPNNLKIFEYTEPTTRKKVVTFSVKFTTEIEYSDDSDLADKISDIDIPENDSCSYVQDSFEVVKE